MATNFKDHSAKVLAAYAGAKSKGLSAMGTTQNSLWTKEINRKGLVETGTFQGSPENIVNDDAVIVGTRLGIGGGKDDPPYPTYLELGTSKMSAKPTLRPSIIEHRDELKTAFSGPFKAIK